MNLELDALFDLDTTTVQRSDTKPSIDSDLDALLAESMSAVTERQDVARARRRLARADCPPSDKAELRALIDHYDDLRVWNTVANVALVQVQTCRTCGAAHEWFQGWMKEQLHRTVAGTRRMVAESSPIGTFPQRVERHHAKPVEHCPSCLAAWIEAGQVAP